MTTPPKPIRIAIVLDGQEFICHEVMVPFSMEGYPPVELVLFGSNPQSQTGLEVKLLPELNPEGFDLILDGQFLLGKRTGITPQKLDNLVAGPPAQFLQKLVCQLQELRHKQEINTGIINSATDALVTINEDHMIVGYNQGAERMFGYTREEALGQDLKLIVPPPHKELHRSYLQRYLATREAHVLGRQRRLIGQRRDGREFPLSISFSVVEIHGSLYFTAIMRDIAEYKAMEDRVLQSERLAAVGNTVAHIAHEIKNPLLIIGGFSRQLLKVPEFDEADRHKLTTIAQEVMHLEEMVAEMRDFVRRPPAQKSQGDVTAAITQALALFQDSFRKQNIQVRQVHETPLPPVAFDPKQLHQVLVNLFKNAQEAMPQGGEIAITSRVRGPNVEITVSDSGVGMPPEVASSIFQPYFTTKETGTGLGLAICQSIMQEHGGCIFAESAPDRGSTFTLQLPLEEAAAGEKDDLSQHVSYHKGTPS
ncbi:MAG: two-component system sensor histidine kinase NtrB [Thermodesulfobacteriota bacterium]